MTLKTYSQNCGLASALDVVGERWSLLIVRTLLVGPARFNEIQAQLPGIGTNLLAARLKYLARWGLVEKQTGRQGSYRLTEKGYSLRPILHQLARWGREFVPATGIENHPWWSMFNIESAFRPERADGLDAVIEFEMAESEFHLVIRKNTCRVAAGPALSADVIVKSDSPSIFVGGGSRLQITGDSAMFDRVRPCFDL
ncbi:MAG TPA: helix-turn-helix domain-containing protein [Xanthomonadales bacterium]|nr:helix-turn-helix domain-containing protein [Xanthomonadales bacterium]